MENRQYYQMDDRIDLKEMILFILRKWRVLLLAGIVGVILGIGVGMVARKPIQNVDIGSLNLTNIKRYARYRQLYELQLEKEAASVYMNMDPDAVHVRKMETFVTAQSGDVNRISEAYLAILQDSQAYNQLLAVSGLDCGAREIQELVSLTVEYYNPIASHGLLDGGKCNIKVTAIAKAPSQAACEAMMDCIAEWVQAAGREMANIFAGFEAEVIIDSHKVGYDAGVAQAIDTSANSLISYANAAEEIKKKLTANEIAYYEAGCVIPEPQSQDAVAGAAKCGILVGILCGAMMAAYYGIVFLIDGHVKTVDELKWKYGLQQIALLQGNDLIKPNCILDRMLAGKYEYNTDEYLRTCIETIGSGRIQLSGDKRNDLIAKKMDMLANGKCVISNRFAVDEQAYHVAAETEGVALFVQLWNTKHDDLIRELEICNRIGQKVLGIVVLS